MPLWNSVIYKKVCSEATFLKAIYIMLELGIFLLAYNIYLPDKI